MKTIIIIITMTIIIIVNIIMGIIDMMNIFL